MGWWFPPQWRPAPAEPMPKLGDGWDGQLATLEQGTLRTCTALREDVKMGGIDADLAELLIDTLTVQMDTIRKLHFTARQRRWGRRCPKP